MKRPSLPDRVGLCRVCQHCRIIQTAKGSSFYYCELSEQNPSFPKYPRLPVLTCSGFEDRAKTKVP
jgi:hypothetical protein